MRRWIDLLMLVLVFGLTWNVARADELVLQETQTKDSSQPLEGSKAGERMVKTVDDIEYAFRWCPAGKFMMGSTKDEWDKTEVKWKDHDEQQHEVTLTKGFWMLETEVTQAMWKSVMGESIEDKHEQAQPGWSLRGKGPDHPMFYVNWDDCQMFCEKLSTQLGMKITLPTEAQWEYACRAGTTTPFNFGSVLNSKQANCLDRVPYGTSTEGPRPEKTVPVRSSASNCWGLYDMHGNVWEWCQDWYGDYPKGSVKDPLGPNSGSYRVIRGGGWGSYALFCRSAARNENSADLRNGHLGFRVVACPSK